MRTLHIVQLLIRENLPGGEIGFLLYPHEHWRDESGKPYLALPAKKTVADPLAEFLQGTPLDVFVDAIVSEDLGLPAGSWALERELAAVDVPAIPSPTRKVPTNYLVYPVDVWVAAEQREPLRERLGGVWASADQDVADGGASPTAKEVLATIRLRHGKYQASPPADDHPFDKHQAEVLRRVFSPVPARPSMDALATKWLEQNLRGVRHLTKETLYGILDAGDRAFNLRVADPYLRYQMQGQGFTWSFFTHKDRQDVHVHGAPVVEIYGVLEGRLEVWWKPYYERGTSAWCHRILEAGDWLEMDALQCHLVHWLTDGKGVVFKAGPGPLAEVGKLGVKGKTPCAGCPCMKPPRVVELESLGK